MGELCRLQVKVLERQHKLQILSLQIQRLQEYHTLANGHKAHWALVTGMFIQTSSKSRDYSPLPGCPHFALLPSSQPPPDMASCLHEDSDLLLVARQSKSLTLSLWGRHELAASCANLKFAASKRRDGSYVLPEDGRLTGLC